MDVIEEVVCGLDVHKESIVACVVEKRVGRKTLREVKSFETHTRGLGALREWMSGKQVRAVAMEGTGIYWRPIYAALESGPWRLVVGNAHHVKNVPGRKTDVKDAEWLAELVQHGLIQPSFVPEPAIRELRDLTRARKKLVEDRTRQQERVLKVLQAANIKLDGVASDTFGVSGMLMLRELIAGEKAPREIAALARGRLKAKVDALELALEGKLGAVHREMLAIAVSLLDGYDAALTRLDELIDRHCEQWKSVIERLKSIVGFERVMAVSVLAEVGPDLQTFESEHHLASWAGVCPGNNESAGKKRDGRPQRGNPYLKTMLCQAAQSAARSKGTYLRDKFYRLKARRGHNKAVMAIAHKLVFAVFHVIKDNVEFKELGPSWLDTRDRHRVARGLVERLEAMGFTVTLGSASTSSAVP
jgi:transposase